MECDTLDGRQDDEDSVVAFVEISKILVVQCACCFGRKPLTEFKRSDPKPTGLC